SVTTVRIAPVSVLIAVTSTPGIAAPEESRTTPDNCEPAIAWARASLWDVTTRATITSSARTSLTVDLPDGPTFLSRRHVNTLNRANQRSYRAVTVTPALRQLLGRNMQPLEWTPGARQSLTPARRTSECADTTSSPSCNGRRS